MQNILVYSATGSQSSSLLSKLQFGENKVYALTRNKQEAAIQENDFVKVIEGSVNDEESLKRANSEMNVVMLNLPFFSDDIAG